MARAGARRARPALEAAGRGVVDGFCLLAMLGMTVAIVVDSSMRSLFSHPIKESLTVVQYWFMPAVTFVGFCMAVTLSRHLTADLLHVRLPGAAQRGITAFGWLVTAACAAAFAFFSIQPGVDALERKQIDFISGLPIWQPQVLVPVACACFAVLSVVAMVRSLRRQDDTAPTPEEALL